MTEHASTDELADAAEGLLDADRAAAVSVHLASCADCRADAAAVSEVSRLLGDEPAPTMPAAVMARLDTVLAQLRADPALSPEPPAMRPEPFEPLAPVIRLHPRPTLGPLATPRRQARRYVVPALAAAAAAIVVGGGAYVLSATAGLNEPPTVAAVVQSGELGPEAGALQRAAELSPHRFSRAWQCARRVTDGRITGLATTTVDGTPALLVYTRSAANTLVTVVTGCAGGRPTAGPSAVVSG